MLDFAIAELQGQVQKVAFGLDRLYLEKAAEFDATSYYGQPCRESDFFAREWDPALLRIARQCREIDARLIVLVAPDAHCVYPEALPDHLSYRTPSIGEVFAAHLRDDLGIEALYPRDLLRAARGGPVDIYQRNDTHWSAYAAYVACRLVIDRLCALWPKGHARKPRLLDAADVTYSSRRMLGDLGWSTEPPFVAEKLLPHVRNQRAHAVEDRSNELRQSITAYEIDDANLPRCVILRDSFATSMSPFLNESFSRIVYVGTGRRAFPELIKSERPDVVIIERGERTLAAGLIDWDFLSDREVVPYFADSGAEKLNNEALALLAEGRLDDAASCARRAIETYDLPDLHFTLGRIHIAAQAFEEAETALQAAVRGDRGRYAFYLQLGIAQLNLLRYAESLASFGHAVVLAPEHPLGFEHFGYVSMLIGDCVGAEIALARAAELWPERPAIQLWRSFAFEKAGKFDQALAAARKAAAIDSGQAVFVDRVTALESQLV